MGGCAAVGCSNSSQKGFIMKRFPKDAAQRHEWLVKMKRVKWKPSDNSSLCEVHFEPQMWERARVDGSRKLKRNAIPTIFSFLQPPGKKRKTNDAESSDVERQSSSGSNSSSEAGDNTGKPNKVTSTVNPNQEKVYNPFSQHKQSVFSSSYPIHQDVKFARLPFYDVISELLKPSSLIPHLNQIAQEKVFYFYLTPQQTADIISSRVVKPNFICEFEKQVQLRFCLSETVCEQEDFFPPNLIVKINNRMCPLPPLITTNKPGVEPKRTSKPVNITPFIKLSSTVVNMVTITWASDYGPGFTVSINLVKKLNAADLVKRLKEKGPMNSDYTRSLIKEKLNDSDAEIVTTCLRVSLLCPLGKMRMTSPCRATTCQHLQCFDSSLFLQMNEKKPTWSCPVCDKPALYNNLIIDGYFKEVLASPGLPSSVNEIELNRNGSWSIHGKVEATSSNSIDDCIEIIDTESIPVETSKPIEIVDLVLSDSDESDSPVLQISDAVISLDTPSPASSNSDVLSNSPTTLSPNYQQSPAFSPRNSSPSTSPNSAVDSDEETLARLRPRLISGKVQSKIEDNNQQSSSCSESSPVSRDSRQITSNPILAEDGVHSQIWPPCRLLSKRDPKDDLYAFNYQQTSHTTLYANEAATKSPYVDASSTSSLGQDIDDSFQQSRDLLLSTNVGCGSQLEESLFSPNYQSMSRPPRNIFSYNSVGREQLKPVKAFPETSCSYYKCMDDGAISSTINQNDLFSCVSPSIDPDGDSSA